MGCGKKFKEKFYLLVKIKDGKITNSTTVELVGNPGLPISLTNLRLFNLVDKSFTKEYSKRNLFYTRNQVKQYNSDLVFFSTSYQIYEENTNSTLTFTGININDSFVSTRPDGKYIGAVSGGTGRFEGATKIVWEVTTDPKDNTKYWTYTVTGYRPKC